MGKAGVVRCVLTAALIGAGSVPAVATESAGSTYLPGSKGPLAGVTPPPGLFLSNDFYFYEGDVGATIELPFGEDVLLGVDAQVWLDVLTALWVTDAEMLGGRFGLGVSVPFGGMSVDAFISPGPTLFADDVTVIADPLLTALIGWDSGNFHWQTGVSVNVPIGDYHEGEPLNLARHYWAANLYGAVTWLDPTIGLDLSSAIGVVFNAENPSTDYRSGTEFHWDWAAVQHFNEQFSAGLVGYYYQQISGDSGDGAVLGDFKGRVAGIGAMVGLNFEVGSIPVSTNVRYYHEFAAENRLEGDAVYFSASIPLWAPH